MKVLYQNLTKYDHIIFDWNGTLLSDVQLVLDILNNNLSNHNLPTLSVDEFRDCFSFPIREFYIRLGMKEELFEAYQKRYHQHYDTHYKGTELYPGTLELIKQLHQEEKTLSVLSAAEEGHLLEAVDHFGILPYMKHVYGLSNRKAEGKQQRGLELLDRAAVAKEKTVLVGDTLYDADVAKFLNIDVILIADGHQSYQQLSKSGCLILPSRYTEA
jgi:phosphoglycolate phosphatase